jgi:hypothetical protein
VLELNPLSSSLVPELIAEHVEKYSYQVHRMLPLIYPGSALIFARTKPYGVRFLVSMSYDKPEVESPWSDD